MNKEARDYLIARRKYMILEYAKAIGNNMEACRDFGVPKSLGIPAQFGHPFRLNSATYSGSNRPPIPAEFGHRFRPNSATPIS